MFSKTIYLIGHINPATPETYEWRKEIVDYFDDRKDINIINPCDSGFDDGLLKGEKEDPENILKYHNVN